MSFHFLSSTELNKNDLLTCTDAFFYSYVKKKYYRLLKNSIYSVKLKKKNENEEEDRRMKKPFKATYISLEDTCKQANN